MATLAGSVVQYVGHWQYHSSKVFTTAAWRINPDERYELTESLIASQRLIGLFRPQVVALLGEPALTNLDYQDASSDLALVHSIGYIPRLDTHDRRDVLVIRFNKQHQVIDVP